MILKLLGHDIQEGTLYQWKRFALVIILNVILCIAFDKGSSFFSDMYGEKWSVLGYEMYIFLGRFPYVFSKDISDSFYIPFEWIMEFFLLAFCIGDYIKRDISGYGMLLIEKSKKRAYWWLSKCIWCLIQTLVFFLVVWLTFISYSWVRYGMVSFDWNNDLFWDYFGNAFEGLTGTSLFVLLLVCPFLVGIVQSIFQLIITLFYDGAAAMVMIMVALVITSYYGNHFLPHSYGMLIRYQSNPIETAWAKNDMTFAVVYLIGLYVIGIILGYFFVRKKNMLNA